MSPRDVRWEALGRAPEVGAGQRGGTLRDLGRLFSVEIIFGIRDVPSSRAHRRASHRRREKRLIRVWIFFFKQKGIYRG